MILSLYFRIEGCSCKYAFNIFDPSPKPDDVALALVSLLKDPLLSRVVGLLDYLLLNY